MHEDQTPFFWLGDTAWNGALLSTPEEWNLYIRERTRQKFTAAQFVATQFRAAPEGDLNHQLAYTGDTNRIVINPAFFQRLDEKVLALNKAGLLGVPVMLWAIGGGSNPSVNPGFALPEGQAILLARYMVARWGAYDVAWAAMAITAAKKRSAGSVSDGRCSETFHTLRSSFILAARTGTGTNSKTKNGSMSSATRAVTVMMTTPSAG